MKARNRRSYREKHSITSFEFRSRDDKAWGVQRINQKSLAVEDLLLDFEHQFWLDRTQIEISPPYKSLSDKSQFVPSNHPFFTTRGSHTLEARTFAHRLGHALGFGPLSMLLTGNVVAGHDIGHAGFSHEAEEVFNAFLAAYGRQWNHDYFGLRILTEFAHAGVSYDGINITAALLECVAKRYWCYPDDLGYEDHHHKRKSYLPQKILDIDARIGLHLGQWAPVEGQNGTLGDWGAFTVSDVRDYLLWALHGKNPGRVTKDRLDEICACLPIAQEVYDRVDKEIKQAIAGRDVMLKSAGKSRQESMIGIYAATLQRELIKDAFTTSEANIAAHAHRIRHAEDVRALPGLLIDFSPELKKQLQGFDDYKKRVIFPRILLKDHVDTKEIIKIIVNDHLNAPGTYPLPEGYWREKFEHLQTSHHPGAKADLVEHVCIYVALKHERDLLWHMKTHHPKEFAALTEGKLAAPWAEPVGGGTGEKYTRTLSNGNGNGAQLIR